MADFLLELFSEEIPARMQPAAAKQLAERFAALLAEAGLSVEHVETHATPRRLALLALGLPAASAATAEERRGPRADAPPQAIEGFLKSTGLTRDQLEERDTGKGVFLFANLKSEGRPTADILAEKLPALITGFQWPKSQRWGPASGSTASPRWVRPLRGIVALLDTEVVPFEAMGLKSGRETFGHRFMGPGAPIEIHSPGAYAGQLLAAKVVLSAEERRAIIREGAEKAASGAGLKLRPDEGLEAENAGLTEWPVPLLGRFDPAYLDVPPEVIQLTMRTNQKYFAVEDKEGRLAPAFVCVANLIATDGGETIVAGNERVLSARLSDARFFWEKDKKTSFTTFAEKLRSVVQHERLGTMAQRVARIAQISELVADGPSFSGIDIGLCRTAALLSKCDLASTTVGEFPELQGIVGQRLLEQADGPVQVARAVGAQYLPFVSLEYSAEAVALLISDRIETISTFFSIGEKPNGSKDPYAIRRSAIALVNTIIGNEIRLPLFLIFKAAVLEFVIQNYREMEQYIGKQFPDAIEKWSDEIQFLGAENKIVFQNMEFQLPDQMRRPLLVADDLSDRWQDIPKEAIDFIIDRLKVQQREAGVRHDLIDAVFALGGEDDLVRLLARVKALQAFVETDDGKNLLAGYKRAANILRIEEKKDGRAYAFDASIPLSKYIGETEKNLARLFVAAEGGQASTFFDEADALFGREDFEGAMKLLATLRAPVDAFFEQTTVNDPDPATRERRLGLLAAIRDCMHRVADFSKIEG
jgi:glycyl-tRNA synthetase beta chain